jgi:uncharacterized membrane protein
MAAVQILLTLAYPALVYALLEVVDARWLALALLGLLALRVGAASRARLLAHARAAALPGAAVAGALGLSAAWNHPLGLRLTPAVVSLGLLLSFAASLRGESVVERLARAQLGSLDAEEVRYCRGVTRLWCGFFLGNALVAAWLAHAASAAEWAAYTGGIAYLLIGLLYAGEYTYRQWRFRRYLGAPTDFLFRRVFPPRP